MPPFFRFPHTPHLLWLGKMPPRDDKVLSAAEVKELLSHEVQIEEKMDGANLGFSLDKKGQLQIQNRGQYLFSPFTGQFSRLDDWLALHAHNIIQHLSPDIILFGEWCAAQHSLDYNSLPDWFLVFDVYQRSTHQFWSVDRRNKLASDIGLKIVPSLKQGIMSLDNIKTMVNQETSKFRSGHIEGLIIRRDLGEWNFSRAKIVRADFVQEIDTHWRSRKIVWNKIDYR